MSVSISDANAVEPASGAAAAVFTISLSSAIDGDVIVTYTTFNDLALAGADYVAATGQVVIPAGSTSATFNINILGDTLFEPNEAFGVRLSNAVNAVVSDGVGFGIIEDNDRPPSVEFPSDKHFAWQWSLFSQYGANVLPVWNDYTGEGIRVAVFDQGIDGSHPDLDGNLSLALSRDAATLSGDGLPERSGDNHGTAVAGVIAAERNGAGIVGVAYGADLVSIYSPLNESVSIFGSRVANAYSYARTAGTDVVNDSWGFGNLFLGGANYAFVDDFASPNFAAAGRELYDLAALGRDGLGTIVVQSAGNAYGYGDDTNLHNFQNSRYVITVAASDYFGQAADYSSPGASILVAAPGGERGGASGIVSTDRVGAAGFTSTDYVFLAGTSFSAPIVSGIVALMLEANPGLGYRDVQEILAYSARRIGADWSNWEFNGAGNWNGGGLHFDGGLHQFGFGLVDATAAVRLAETWGPARTVANLQELSFTRTPHAAIPDNDAGGISSSISVTQHIEIERVDVRLDIAHPFIGDLSVALESPSGTWSWLLFRPGAGPYTAFGSSQENIHFTFDTVASWGEDSAGQWTLFVFDDEALLAGTLDSWTLTLTGKPASDDDTYIFTDEYPESLAADSARGTLVDGSGADTLSVAAVSGASALNLTPGTTSAIDGASLLIGAATVIENAIGGDGNDAITGNFAANFLRGMRGHDQLTGGGGNDTLDGGAGVDTAVYSSSRDAYVLTPTPSGFTVEGSEGSDSLLDIERLQFSDKSLAFDLGVGAAAGNTVRIIGAAFGTKYIIPEAVGIGISLFDGGMSLPQLCALVLGTDLFLSLAGSASNDDFVNTVYENVVGAPPSAEEHNFYVGFFQGSGGTMTQAEVLVLAANTDLIAQNINLVGLQASGVEFT